MHANVNLSRLVATRTNPRRVRPDREAHRRLVASIRAHGLIEPLVVQPADEQGYHRLIAGNRRLAALRVVHRGEDPRVRCEVRDADEDTARTLSLAENFAREGMHPLDEAECFARLASIECKGVAAIAAEFGVSHGYVRQRMKLATLAPVVKGAYRAGAIDTATAGAFAAVPPRRQTEVWEQMGGHPRNAEQVRAAIEHAWIEADHALFDVVTLPASAVSRDLFGERTLVEREAFMLAQMGALAVEEERLREEGWNDVVVATHEEAQERLRGTEPAGPVYDEATRTRLVKIEEQRRALEEPGEKAEEDPWGESGEWWERTQALEREEDQTVSAASVSYADATKAVGTAFLVLSPDGKVQRVFRVPRERAEHRDANGTHRRSSGPHSPPRPLTSEDLTSEQRAEVFAQEAAAVRNALLGNERAMKRVLVLILHGRVSKDGLTVRHEVCREGGEAEDSPAGMVFGERRASVDPFAGDIDEAEAYRRLGGLPEERTDALIDVLTAACLTHRGSRSVALVRALAGELGVDLREGWRPDAAWLGAYPSCQTLKSSAGGGPTPRGSAPTRKVNSPT